MFGRRFRKQDPVGPVRENNREVLLTRVPFRHLFIRVPYSVVDLKRAPDSENYPNTVPKGET